MAERTLDAGAPGKSSPSVKREKVRLKAGRNYLCNVTLKIDDLHWNVVEAITLVASKRESGRNHDTVLERIQRNAEPKDGVARTTNKVIQFNTPENGRALRATANDRVALARLNDSKGDSVSAGEGSTVGKVQKKQLSEDQKVLVGKAGSLRPSDRRGPLGPNSYHPPTNVVGQLRAYFGCVESGDSPQIVNAGV
jgi:hypothetical protein